jgi:hypothetical protein
MALGEIGADDARRHYFDQHFAVARARHRPFDDLQRFRAAGRRRDDGMHRGRNCWHVAAGGVLDDGMKVGAATAAQRFFTGNAVLYAVRRRFSAPDCVIFGEPRAGQPGTVTP